MPISTGGGASNITGASVVDASLSSADLSAATIATLNPTCVTCIPQPVINWDGFVQIIGAWGNTTMAIGLVNIPTKITVNKISAEIVVNSAAGTSKWALFSENGQTKVFEHTTTSISGTGVQTQTLSAPVEVNAGNYWIAVLPVGTTGLEYRAYNTNVSGSALQSVTSEPVLMGTLTVTANTIPSTITPTSITGTTSTVPIFRFDN